MNTVHVPLYLVTQGRGGGGEGGKGVDEPVKSLVHKKVENTNMTDCISSNSIKHQ
jgi:hypothetical protein